MAILHTSLLPIYSKIPSMEIFGFRKRVQKLVSMFNRKKNIITPKKLRKACDKPTFFVYVRKNNLFEDFIRAFEQDIETLNTKK